MAGAGQGDIEQAQVFLQALFFGQGQRVVAQAKINLNAAVRPGQRRKTLAAQIGRAKGGGEWQAHHRVFQALGLVHGDELDQIGVALQAQHLLVTAGPATVLQVSQLGRQPADQRLLAVQLGTGSLQQFG